MRRHIVFYSMPRRFIWCVWISLSASHQWRALVVWRTASLVPTRLCAFQYTSCLYKLRAGTQKWVTDQFFTGSLVEQNRIRHNADMQIDFPNLSGTSNILGFSVFLRVNKITEYTKRWKLYCTVLSRFDHHSDVLHYSSWLNVLLLLRPHFPVQLYRWTSHSANVNIAGMYFDFTVDI